MAIVNDPTRSSQLPGASVNSDDLLLTNLSLPAFKRLQTLVHTSPLEERSRFELKCSEKVGSINPMGTSLRLNLDCRGELLVQRI